MRISLDQYKNSSSNMFSGRPQGEECRKKINLDRIDLDDEVVYIEFPEDTESINPSFYLGFLFPSIKKLGANRFIEKYKFVFRTTDDELVNSLLLDLEDGFRNAVNSMNNNTGLNYFK